MGAAQAGVETRVLEERVAHAHAGRNTVAQMPFQRFMVQTMMFAVSRPMSTRNQSVWKTLNSRRKSKTFVQTPYLVVARSSHCAYSDESAMTEGGAWSSRVPGQDRRGENRVSGPGPAGPT